MPFWKDENGNPVSDNEYHGRRDLIGSSMLNDFLKDPNIYFMKYVWEDQEGNLGHPSFHAFDCEDKKQLARRITFDFGSAVHAMLLTPSNADNVVIKRDSGARIASFYFKHKNCFIIPESNSLGEDWEMLMTCVTAAKNNKLIAKMVGDESRNEIAYTMKDPFLGALNLKVKWDTHGKYSSKQGGFFSDIKTTKSSSISSFLSKFLPSGYPLQAALYASAYKDAYGEYPTPSQKGGSGIFYIVIPKERKFCNPYIWELPKEILDMGLKKFEKAVISLAECYDKGFDHMYNKIILPDLDAFKLSATEID